MQWNSDIKTQFIDKKIQLALKISSAESFMKEMKFKCINLTEIKFDNSVWLRLWKKLNVITGKKENWFNF